jgi:hypothetical protein
LNSRNCQGLAVSIPLIILLTEKYLRVERNESEEEETVFIYSYPIKGGKLLFQEICQTLME